MSGFVELLGLLFLYKTLKLLGTKVKLLPASTYHSNSIRKFWLLVFPLAEGHFPDTFTTK